jgi:Arc/MetJ family transcription regulator
LDADQYRIDPELLAEAQRLSGHATKEATVDKALRLLVRLRGQKQVNHAFGKYPWRGDLKRSRRGRATMSRRNP